MSRPSRRSLLNRCKAGDPCERKKPCSGVLQFDHEKSFAFSGIAFQWWRCDECGKKHYSKARKVA